MSGHIMKFMVEALKAILVERKPLQTTGIHLDFFNQLVCPLQTCHHMRAHRDHSKEPRDGKLFFTKVVVVRFLESEATLPSILDKVKLAMGNNEIYVLTDAHGSQVLESEGTTDRTNVRPQDDDWLFVCEWSKSRRVPRRSAVLGNGMWDQVRVDHGKEFYLTLFMQEMLSGHRHNQERRP
ncbi:unnamed protein product [Leuciscus chuanchicus]